MGGPDGQSRALSCRGKLVLQAHRRQVRLSAEKRLPGEFPSCYVGFNFLPGSSRNYQLTTNKSGLCISNGIAVNWAQDLVFRTWMNRLGAPARAVVQPTTLARIRDLVRARTHSRAEDLGGAVARLGPFCTVTVECTDYPRPGGWAWRAAVVHAALRASLDTLTTLSLCVPLEVVSAFLPPALPRLHTLVVRLFTLPVVFAAVPDPRALRVAEAHMGAFVARHTGSLRSLDFSMPPIYVEWFLGPPRVIEHYVVDVARVLCAVPPAPQLTAVALSILSTAPAASLPPIAEFLTTHRSTLRALALTVGRSYAQWSPAEAATTPALLGALRLPQLADLSIRCTGTAWPADAALEAAVCTRRSPPWAFTASPSERAARASSPAPACAGWSSRWRCSRRACCAYSRTTCPCCTARTSIRSGGVSARGPMTRLGSAVLGRSTRCAVFVLRYGVQSVQKMKSHIIFGNPYRFGLIPLICQSFTTFYKEVSV
ncbi:hypothetical protein HYPSUDRAFT_279048 [Hypholoma sublateritium FD-334 SS-4]|uniref:Uncharacterized protein n=1 Tax=Hypholoma sublateritium (strain FD-334 SS-4) TaxID=945553 RepID=A0A0D2LG37_HYPSF|nr:hypothetical protein HYPSUDRAFT_279048 [Hypholoma sublateritium FD-334 SS-4]